VSRGSRTNSSGICGLGPTLRAQQVRNNNTRNEVVNVMKALSRNSPGLPAHSLATKRWMLGHLPWLAVLLSQLALTTVCAASEVTAWGCNDDGQTNVPSGLSNVVAIAAGADYSLALMAEGRVLAWGGGSNWWGQMDVPSGLSNVVAIAAGDLHSLALTAEGQVVAWGDNGWGQTDVPSGLSNVVGITAGRFHSLALTAEGRVVAWGHGLGPGYLGCGSCGSVWSDQAIVPSGLSNVVAIAGGAYHSLALTAGGRVVAWGGGNCFGETTVPSELSNVVAIAVGGNYSLALTAEGRVVAWGGNDYGETDVPSGLSNVVAITAGVNHSLALTAEGRVLAWGASWNGQTDVPTGLSNVVAIAAGDYHNLTLSGLPPGVAAPALVGPRFLVVTVDRSFHHRIVARNGVTIYGAAGLPPGLVLDPDTGLITGQPAQAGTYSLVLSATNSMGSSAWTVTLFVNEPAAPGIGSGGVVVAVLGPEFSYAVVAYNAPEWYGAVGLPPGWVIGPQSGVISGVPVEFGDFVVSLMATNRYGLGTGSLTIRVSPVVAWGDHDSGQVDVPGGLSNVVAIAAGGDHSLALSVEGRVVAWGGNDYGETDVPSGLSNVVAIAAGDAHSLALTAEGQVVAWGNNYLGQTNVPSGLSNVVGIAAGKYYSLALTDEGRVVAWGKYYDGSDYVAMTVPSGLSNVVAVAAGAAHNLALTAEGRVVAWGGNDAGPTNGPSGLSNVVGIAAGYYYSLALTAEGRVVAWGDQDVPSGLSNVVAIAAGDAHSLALTAEGQMVAWGNDEAGQADVPSGLSNVVAIAAGGWHSLALLRQPTVRTPRLELSGGVSGLELQARGAPGISCQLLRASRLSGPWLPAQPVTFTNSVQLLRAPDTSESSQFFRLLRK
jgi:alpha-tubulin suppressor-like RCC1 family protein